MPNLKTVLGRQTDFVPVWRKSVDDYVQSVAWTPDGREIAAAAVSGAIVTYETRTGQILHSLKGHKFGTTTVSYNAAGDCLASAGQDGLIRLWNRTDGTERAALAGGAVWVEHLAWQPGGEFLASGAGRKLRLWNAQGETIQEYPDHPSTIAGVSWQPGKGNVLASAQYGGIQLWATDRTEPMVEFNWKGSILALAWSPDGKYIATGDQDSTVHFWIVAKEQDLQMWGYLTKVRELAWSPDSRYLATGGGPVVTIWDTSGKGPEGTRPITLEAHEGNLSALAFQPHGAVLASGGQDGLFALWQPGKHRKSLARIGLGSPISQIVWSPDGRRVAVGTEDGSLALFVLPI
jgi:WD40 repeat protein